MKESVYINQERREALRKEWKQKEKDGSELPPRRRRTREQVWELITTEKPVPSLNIQEVEEKDVTEIRTPRRRRTREELWKLITELL